MKEDAYLLAWQRSLRRNKARAKKQDWAAPEPKEAKFIRTREMIEADYFHLAVARMLRAHYPAGYIAAILSEPRRKVNAAIRYLREHGQYDPAY